MQREESGGARQRTGETVRGRVSPLAPFLMFFSSSLNVYSGVEIMDHRVVLYVVF